MRPPTASTPAAAAVAARAQRRTGLALSSAALAAAAATAVAGGVVPPDAALATLAAALALPAAGVAVARAVYGDALVIDGGLPPSIAIAPRWRGPGPRPNATPALAVVLDAGAGRGRGVVATAPIPAAAFVGRYEGDVLDTASFWARFPSGVGDYTMSAGPDAAIDGAPIAAAADAAAAAAVAAGRAPTPPPYSPCFINHSAKRANVARVTRAAARRVDLYAARDIEPGEELLLDYGATYWTGREGSVVD